MHTWERRKYITRSTRSLIRMEHAEECGLNITNTMFEKRKGKLWTFISDMNGRKSQIDCILVLKVENFNTQC